MKKGNIFMFLLSIIFIFGGCNQKLKDASNTLNITQADEKVIQEYLDTKTNDISSPYKGGKMYSAFKILGTDSNKIYVWMLKEECSKQGSEITTTNGVSLPLVLYIKTGKDRIEIIKHKYPEDGEGYGRDIQRLFPQNVINGMSENPNESAKQLEEIIKNRVEGDM